VSQNLAEHGAKPWSECSKRVYAVCRAEARESDFAGVSEQLTLTFCLSRTVSLERWSEAAGAAEPFLVNINTKLHVLLKTELLKLLQLNKT
jgi:hypothetical protein